VEIEDGDAEDGESNAETNSEMEDEWWWCWWVRFSMYCIFDVNLYIN
jgi:hypothetical protein